MDIKNFETAYLNAGGKSSELEKEDGEYVSSKSQMGWQMWQAATAQAVPEGFVLVRNKPVAYMVQNKSWTYQEGNNYFEAKLLKEMPEPAFDGDSYDIEIPLYMIEAQEQSHV